jgi:hypothetical protein
MTHLLLGSEAIGKDLEHRLLTRVNTLAALIQAAVDGRGNCWRLSDLVKATGVLTDALAGRPPFDDGAQGETVTVRACGFILDALVDPRERREAAFWASPLGRAVAWWTGGEEASEQRDTADRTWRGVHRAEAAAALGISRQALHELMGKYPRRFDPNDTSPTGISALGLKREMRERYPQAAS